MPIVPRDAATGIRRGVVLLDGEHGTPCDWKRYCNATSGLRSNAGRKVGRCEAADRTRQARAHRLPDRMSAWTDKSMLEEGQFYPRKTMSPEDCLWWDAQYSDVVEVNSGFYAIASALLRRYFILVSVIVRAVRPCDVPRMLAPSITSVVLLSPPNVS